MAIFRVEKIRDFTIMSNYHLQDKTLSLKAVGLLSKILGLPDNWNYSTCGLAAISKDGVDSIGSGLRELEKAGYLVRRQLRDERGRITDTEYTVYERPQTIEPVEPDTAPPDTGDPHTGNPDMAGPCTDATSQLNMIPSRTKNKKRTDKSSIDQSPAGLETASAPIQGMDKIEEKREEARIYREIVMENLEYENLVQQYDQDRVDKVVELILEQILSDREYSRISGSDILQSAVKNRFLKLTGEHVEYVFDSMDQNTTEVRNIKAYILAALYNAPVTMNSFYRAKVNHDLYGGEHRGKHQGFPSDDSFGIPVPRSARTAGRDRMPPHASPSR